MRSQGSKGRVVGELIVILLLYYWVTMVFMVAPPLTLNALGLHLGLRPGTAITLGGVLAAELIALGGVRAYYKRKGIALKQLGWKTPARPVAILVVAWGAAALYIGFSFQIPEVRANAAEISWFKAWGLLAGVGGAFLEEVIFRGYLMARMEQVKFAPIVQVLLTAVTFGVLHLGFGISGVACTFVLGLVLGGLYLLGRRHLLGPMLCHGVVNAVLEPWLLLWLLRFYSGRAAS
jgi:uncharacterized protein